ncbi:MAG: AAC(3) family N-acetyltransferase [Thermoguttaceae bacterium]
MDGIPIGAELLGKHIYWSFTGVRKIVQKLRGRRDAAPRIIDRQELKRHLQQIGVTAGALVMAHSSVSNLQFSDNAENKPAIPSFFRVAEELVNDLLELVGPTGTLVMPTHANYQGKVEPSSSGLAKEICYDPLSTPCAVGLANELFWRRKGVLRSLHPYNTLAAYGPLAEELLRDNLNQHKPLPHGIYSGYYRLCQRKGLVVSIGLPLRKCMTLLHVGEDVRDQEWPIKNFFQEYSYLVRINNRNERNIVRQCRSEYGKYALCRWKAFADLIRDQVLHEGEVNGVPVGWARANEVFDYLMRRNRNSTYPYYATWLAGLRN